MFEHYHQPVLPRTKFLGRMARAGAVAIAVLAVTLLLGMLVFAGVEGESPIDSFLNAVLVMTGLGVVDPIRTDAGKILAAFYALFSAIAFFSVLAILFSPPLHRLLHRLHLETRGK